MNYCCLDMEEQLELNTGNEDKYECSDTVLIKENNGDYGLSIKDGGTSYYVINYCPFCGSRLRDELKYGRYIDVSALD